MSYTRKALSVAMYNFRMWRGNPRVILAFCLAFILCFLLTDKAVSFAVEYSTTMQIAEAFVWTFGDANSILLTSLLLMLLFADMPFISPATPFLLMRVSRKAWIMGQTLYIVAATALYLLFILASTALLSAKQSFVQNMWSETAAILGYSGAGRAIALPAFVKTMEITTPYACMATICALMLLYALLMAFIMLLFNLKKGVTGGVFGAFAFSVYGFLLNPQTLLAIFRLRDEFMYKMNVLVGWISPLNHATYHMHSFGYDLLPRIWQTCVIFSLLIALCFALSLRAVRKYSFYFTGTEAA